MKTLLILLAFATSAFAVTQQELDARYQAEISRRCTITAAKQKEVDLIKSLLADQAGHGGDTSSYRAKWDGIIAGYAKNGISTAEKQWTAIINQFFAAVATIPPETSDTGSIAIALKSGDLSSPATWGGRLPIAGQDVKIDSGIEVTCCDTPLPVLGDVTINGSLAITKDVSLTAKTVMVHGSLTAGTAEKPFLNKLAITLNGIDKTAIPGMGGRGLVAMMGGQIKLFGAPRVSWLMLDADAPAGADTLTLSAAVDWKPGDRIIVAATGYQWDETEEAEVASVAEKVVKLKAPLRYFHSGPWGSYEHHKDAPVPRVLDMRAEVGCISSNIRIQPSDDLLAEGYGGQVMIMDSTSVGQFSNVEFYHMGQAGLLGRYPLHFHNVKDGGANCFVRNCSIHHSFNRSLTVHATNKTTIADNVCYDTFGHMYFMEDGVETENVFTHNLGATVRPSRLAPGGIDLDLMPAFFNDLDGVGGASVFWITNPNNDFVDNAAVGTSLGEVGGPWYKGNNGFWIAIIQTPQPGSISYKADPTYNPSAQPLGIFKGNRAHSITGNGETVNGLGFGLWLREEGENTPVIEDFTSFSNGHGAMWLGAGINKTVTVRRAAIQGDEHPVLNRSAAIVEDSLVVHANRPEHGQPYNVPLPGVPPSAFYVYEGLGLQVRNSVMIGFNQSAAIPSMIFAHHAALTIGYDAFENCESIDSVFGIGDFHPDAELWVNDPDDMFGNGGPGIFIRSMTAPANAKPDANGIVPGQNTYWVPQ